MKPILYFINYKLKSSFNNIILFSFNIRLRVECVIIYTNLNTGEAMLRFTGRLIFDCVRFSGTSVGSLVMLMLVVELLSSLYEFSINCKLSSDGEGSNNGMLTSASYRYEKRWFWYFQNIYAIIRIFLKLYYSCKKTFITYLRFIRVW